MCVCVRVVWQTEPGWGEGEGRNRDDRGQAVPITRPGGTLVIVQGMGCVLQNGEDWFTTGFGVGPSRPSARLAVESLLRVGGVD